MAKKIRIVGVGTAGTLIPDSEIRRDLNLSRMSLWRWDRDPAMAAIGWPPAVRINDRNHREADKYEEFKSRLARVAISRRTALLEQHQQKQAVA
jgi:hypothetical protein